MQLIARKREISILKNMMVEKRPHFLAVYGRRRVGKTYLLHEFFSHQNCLFMTVTGLKDGNIHQQLEIFRKALEQTFYSGLTLADIPNWVKAFELLTEAIAKLPKTKRVVILLDELPWLAAPRSGLLQALEHAWNANWSRRDRLILITCGSAAFWILENLVHAKGGLYNRVTETLLLEPFTLKETTEYLEAAKIKVNREQALELYMAFGGIPHYLNHVKRGKSIRQNINDICFTKQGALLKEFDLVFKSLFESSEAHNAIVRLCANSRKGLTREQLIERSPLLQTGGQLSKWLDELRHAGFIEKYIPYAHTSRGLYYRLIDEYSLFYLTWIEPKKHMIETWNIYENYWEKLFNTPQYKSWSGYTFESICYKHVNEIKKALGITEILSEIGTWRYVPTKGSPKKGAQIDLLFDRQDGVINLCEIKFSRKPFAIDKAYAETLQRKIACFKQITQTKKVILLTFVTVNGVAKNTYYHQFVDNEVTLDDLF